jgi:hypothetical protein
MYYRTKTSAKQKKIETGWRNLKVIFRKKISLSSFIIVTTITKFSFLLLIVS